jgi:hypothetical protein
MGGYYCTILFRNIFQNIGTLFPVGNEKKKPMKEIHFKSTILISTYLLENSSAF